MNNLTRLKRFFKSVVSGKSFRIGLELLKIGTNYPDRIFHERELWRYMDVMQENSYATNLDAFDNGLSQFEFDTAKKVISRFKKFSATISNNYCYKNGR